MPITDKPTVEATHWDHYVEGTYECYELFRSKAKITTYKSLKWHLLVLWYLNPQLDQDDFMEIAEIIVEKSLGFTSFEIHPELLRKMVYEVSMLDLDEPPKNKLRKVIFKYGNPLSKEEKLRIVGTLIGRSKKVHQDDIYQCMIDLNDMGKSITIGRIAGLLDCSTRTIHRNMCEELKREKELLNAQLINELKKPEMPF
jgi:signal recognition particle GTPase